MNSTETTPEEGLLSAIDAVKRRGIKAELVEKRGDALEKIETLLPDGILLITAASETLREVGFVDELRSGRHGWRNLSDEIRAENDPEKRAMLRRQSVTAAYSLGSVAAIAETGEIVVASGSGSQLIAYLACPNVIWVAGTQKIVPTLEDAVKRTRDYCAPRVEESGINRLGRNGMGTVGKLMIFEHEAAYLRRNVHLILVNEPLGF